MFAIVTIITVVVAMLIIKIPLNYKGIYFSTLQEIIMCTFLCFIVSWITKDEVKK